MEVAYSEANGKLTATSNSARSGAGGKEVIQSLSCCESWANDGPVPAIAVSRVHKQNVLQDLRYSGAVLLTTVMAIST